MAYREFWQDTGRAEVDYSPIERGLTNLFQSIATAQTQKRRAADQFQYDLSEGKFENDQKILTEYAGNVVNRGRQEYLQQGRLSNQTQQMMGTGKGWQQQSDIQFEKAKNLQQEIVNRATKDKYYDPQTDLDRLKVAVNGENNDVDFRTRGERINAYEGTIGGVDSFKFNDYRADYVKNIGSQYKERTSGNANTTKTIYDQATFWDNGKPGVSDQAAVDFINSDSQGRIEQYYNQKLDQQYSKEIESMKASGDPRAEWMKGKSDAEIKNELINDPSRNIINNKDFGVRKRETVKRDLSEADRINSKVSVDYKADKSNNNGGLYKNDNIVHSYAFSESKMQAAVPGSGEKFSPSMNAGPGGVLSQKNGNPLKFNSTNPVRTDVNTGITNKVKIGSVPFNLTGYQLQAFKSSGAPITLNGNTVDEQIANINSKPFEFFDPNGAYKPEPTMSVALQGFTVNQAGMLNAANNQEQTLQSQLNDAEQSTDPNKEDRIAMLEMQLAKIQSTKALIGSGVDDTELALAASRSGIKGIQVNELVKASGADMANIKATTQGFDLSNRQYWSNDMTRLADAWEKRYKEAQAAGFKSAEAAKPKKTATKTKTVITPDEFTSKWSTLKSGETLVGPDGVTYTKK